MNAPLRLGKFTFHVIAFGGEPPRQAEKLTFRDRTTVMQLLQRLTIQPEALNDLRLFIQRRFSLGVFNQWTNAQVLEQLAWRISTGELQLYRVFDARYRWFYASRDKEEVVEKEQETSDNSAYNFVLLAESDFEDIVAEFEADPDEVDLEVEFEGDPDEFDLEVEFETEEDEYELEVSFGEDPIIEPEEFADEQIAPLIQASEVGVPFCEECGQAQPEPSPVVKTPEPEPPTPPEAVETEIDFPNSTEQAAAMREAAESGASFCQECS